MRTQEAEDLLHHCLDEGNVRYGTHFKVELRNEGVLIGDALDVLRRGRIYNPPEQDIKTGEWKYRVEGHEPDGKWLAIVFCFKAVDTAFLITVFSVQTRSR